MAKIKELFLKYKEIIMYLVFGVLTTLVSWGSYALFEIAFGLFIKNTIALSSVANVLSWIVAVLFAFITNKLWVFESKSFKGATVVKEFGAFVGSRLLTGVLEWFGVPLLMLIGLDQSILGIEGMLAKILISVIVVILNYILSKLLVFRKKKK